MIHTSLLFHTTFLLARLIRRLLLSHMLRLIYATFLFSLALLIHTSRLIYATFLIHTALLMPSTLLFS